MWADLSVQIDILIIQTPLLQPRFIPLAYAIQVKQDSFVHQIKNHLQLPSYPSCRLGQSNLLKEWWNPHSGGLNEHQ